jgi:hypothetical protein
MKTSTLSESEKPWLVETQATVWDRILDLMDRMGSAMDRKEAELDQASLLKQVMFITPMLLAGMYIGIGTLRCMTVVLVGGTKVPLDMTLDWWWVALLN